MRQISALATLVLSVLFALSPLFTDPFSGFESDQLPVPQVDPPIQPAGYAFAIWGLLYAWLIVSAVFGVLKRRADDGWHRARLPLIASLAIGVPWLAIANASAIWATFCIILMAIGAIAATLRAPAQDRWWFQAPVALYAGWLTAASCVSLGSTLAGYGILTGSTGWAVIGITLGLILAILVFRQRPSAPEYLGPVIWALVGIAVANGSDLWGVTLLALAGSAVLLGLAVIRAR